MAQVARGIPGSVSSLGKLPRPLPPHSLFLRNLLPLVPMAATGRRILFACRSLRSDKTSLHRNAKEQFEMATKVSGPVVPLVEEDRVAVDTRTAAYHLNRAEQTLRIWACRENGPLRPVRIFGRLAWPVAELRRLLGVA